MSPRALIRVNTVGDFFYEENSDYSIFYISVQWRTCLSTSPMLYRLAVISHHRRHCCYNHYFLRQKIVYFILCKNNRTAYSIFIQTTDNSLSKHKLSSYSFLVKFILTKHLKVHKLLKLTFSLSSFSESWSSWSITIFNFFRQISP